MPTSVGRVVTETPERYAKQLCDHLGRRSVVEFADGNGRIVLTAGVLVLRSEPGLLTLSAEAKTDDDLAAVQDVAARHLERFGRRTELQVEWSGAGTASTPA